jgi:lysophospholipid acyltransferase (LPLAT)-like uncharacterized protein
MQTLSGAQPVALSPWRRLAYGAAAPALDVLMRLLWASCRIHVLHAGGRVPSADQPIIPCFWHQHLVLCASHLRALDRQGFRLGWLISPSRDGELAARVARRWPIRVIRGSTTRTGLKAMRDLYRATTTERISPVMLPDGPHGPARCFKPGAIMLAQLTSAPLLPMAAAAERAWHLGSWDKMTIPRPFTRVVVALGEPRRVRRDLPPHRLEDERRAIEEVLESLERAAHERLCGTTASRTPP